MVSNSNLLNSLKREANKYKTSSDMYNCGIYDGLISCAKWLEGARDIDGIVYEGRNMVYSSQYYENEMKTAKDEDEMSYFEGMSKGFGIGSSIVSDWLYDMGY